MNKDLQMMPLGYRFDASVDTIAPQFLITEAMKDGISCVYSDHVSGFTNESFKDLRQLFVNRGGRKLAETFYDDGGDVLYQWPDGFAQLLMSSGGKLEFTISSLDDKWLFSFKKEMESKLSENNKQGYIFAIMRGAGGALQLTRVGYAGTSLERGNYSDEVVSQFDLIVKDFKSENPSGRIAILEGNPGVGKTRLVRSLLSEAPDAMFVLVPPTMVSSLGGPDLLPLLLRNKEDYQKTGPTVLILEDADECLVPRAGDNMASISSILNMGDGIFGSLFDIRIIATTNARKTEMDPAIIRAGRLSQRVEVKALSYDKANSIFQRLVPGKDLELKVESVSEMRPVVKKDKITLAEVYKAAREAGWEPEKIKKLIPRHPSYYDE